jgi:hypothetical protein
MSHIGCVATGGDEPEALTGRDPLLPSETNLTGMTGGFCGAGAAMLACRVERC